MIRRIGSVSGETRTFPIQPGQSDGASNKYKAFDCNNSTQYSNVATRATELLEGDSLPAGGFVSVCP